jgi:hypothetical protein
LFGSLAAGGLPWALNALLVQMLTKPIMVVRHRQNIVKRAVRHFSSAPLAVAQAEIVECQARIIMPFKFTDNLVYKVSHVLTSAFNNLLKFVLRTGPPKSGGPLAKRWASSRAAFFLYRHRWS